MESFLVRYVHSCVETLDDVVKIEQEQGVREGNDDARQK
jgi:hypothetical protein